MATEAKISASRIASINPATGEVLGDDPICPYEPTHVQTPL